MREAPTSREACFYQTKNRPGFGPQPLVTLDNFADRTVSHRRRIIQVSALSTFVGTVLAYRGSYG